MSPWILALAVSAFYGSLPFTVIVARTASGADPRAVGSGLPGVANTAMIVGRPLGFLVALLEGSKGLVAIGVPTLLGLPPEARYLCLFAAVAATGSSPWLGFKGGHARTPGIWGLLVVQPLVLVVAFATYGVALLVGRSSRRADTLALLTLGPSLGALTQTVSGLIAGGVFSAYYLWRRSVLASDTSHYRVFGSASE